MRPVARRRSATAVGALVLLPLALTTGTTAANSASTGADPIPLDVAVPVDVYAVPRAVTMPASRGSIGTLVATTRRSHQAASTVSFVDGVPVPALRAYRRAAAAIERSDPTCSLPWQVLAGIGRVESDHGRFAGAVIDADGVSMPRIVGIALDGSAGFAAIPDTDDGRYDGDRTWDRAVGPMQFIPATWEQVGADADGDGVANPDDLDDAALGAARYLCAGDADLGEAAALRAAVLRYNHSTAYVDLVLSSARAYAGGGVEAVPVTPPALTVPALTVPALTVPTSGPAAGDGNAGNDVEASAAPQPDGVGQARRRDEVATPTTGGQPGEGEPDGSRDASGVRDDDARRERRDEAGSRHDDPASPPRRGENRPDPRPDRTPKPAPDPVPRPDPNPAPDPVPRPDPNPAPDPDPRPDPKPAPDPDPRPDPKPAPDPDPRPDPKPAPDSDSRPDPKPGPGPLPAPGPQPEPDPLPVPGPQPEPGPGPDTEPVLAEITGVWQPCVDTGWCLDERGLDVGDTETLQGLMATHDYDGDGAEESVRAELRGLRGTTVTLEVLADEATSMSDGAGARDDGTGDEPTADQPVVPAGIEPLVVWTINEAAYRGIEGTLPAEADGPADAELAQRGDGSVG